MPWLAQLVDFAQQIFVATVGQSPLPLLIVAAYAGTALLLYGLTRGKEFLIAGYSSVLFLAPLIRL